MPAEKPRFPIDALSSERAAIEYDIAVELWGEDNARRLGRVCRAVARKFPDYPLACPEPPAE